jgi:NAD-dependent protein deacetylase/lipoamidase
VAQEIVDESAVIQRVATLLHQANSVVYLTGAGISTESGIPDFRGPQGVWTKNPAAEKSATLDNFMNNRDVRVNSWKNRLGGGMIAGVEPNAGHIALAELEALGKVSTLVTQNIDGLHQAAGSSQRTVVEIHGTVHDYRCMGCGDLGPIEVVLQRVEAGDEDPACKLCGGILKTATISFGQSLIRKDLERSRMAAASSDLLIAIGTSLAVYPVAAMPEIALQSNAKFVVINAQETPFDGYANEVLRGQIGAVLPAIVEELKAMV